MNYFENMTGKTFAAIDFETACAERSSACSLGIIVMANGDILERRQWLIRPYPFYFHWGNVKIHGIKPEDVISEPKFDELWGEISEYLTNTMVIAHNAAFDMSVLRHLLNAYDLAYPSFDYLCTKKLAEKQWPQFEKYGLSYVSEQLKIDFKHHDALEDAYACAQIAVKACRENGTSNLYELTDLLGIRFGKLYPGGYQPASIKDSR